MTLRKGKGGITFLPGENLITQAKTKNQTAPCQSEKGFNEKRA